MTTQTKQHAARIKLRREKLGFPFAEFYEKMQLTPREAEWIEDGQYGHKTNEQRRVVDEVLDRLEKEAGTYKAPRFIQPQQAGRKLTMPAARFLIVTEDGRSVTKAADDIRQRRLGLGVERNWIPGLLPNQVDRVEVGVYHEHWVNFANKIWEFLDQVEERNRALTAPTPYVGVPDLTPEIIDATREVMTRGVDEVLARTGSTHEPAGTWAKVTLDGVELLSQPEKFPTQKQCIEFADNLGQWMLKHDRDIITIPMAEFYTMLFQQTGANRLNISMMELCFGEHVVGGAVAFLFSVGEHVVVVCKDSNFAPVDLPE